MLNTISVTDAARELLGCDQPHLLSTAIGIRARGAARWWQS